MKVLIAGAGIGGLTAALCCHYFGHDVHVFERADELGDVGAGLQLPPNAMKVFKALGIDTRIAQNAFRPESIEARMGKTGRSIFTIPLADAAMDMWNAPYLHIHRVDYVATLSQALIERAPNSLTLGADIVGYENEGDNIHISLGDGRKISGDLLIGADGIHSAIRAQMHGADQAVFTKNVAWRAVVPIDKLGANVPNPTACVWMGAGRHAVTYRLGEGQLTNFVGVVETEDWPHEGWARRGMPKDALADFQDWHPVITTLIEAALPESLYRWALYDRKPLPYWSDGRAVLLGDAAHPMLPFLAQGAAMAVEDSWVIAKEMSRTDEFGQVRPIQDSLQAFQDLRYKRCSKVQARSRANMKTFHQATQFGKLKTYGPMWAAGKFVPSLVHKRMDWLYRHDVTKD